MQPSGEVISVKLYRIYLRLCKANIIMTNEVMQRNAAYDDHNLGT